MLYRESGLNHFLKNFLPKRNPKNEVIATNKRLILIAKISSYKI